MAGTGGLGVGVDHPDGAAVDALGTLDVVGARLDHRVGVFPDGAHDPGGQAARVQVVHRGVGGLRGDDRDHAHAHVEGAFEVGQGDVAQLGDQLEDRRQFPGGAVHGGQQALRQDAGEVGGQAAAGDVAEAVHGLVGGGAVHREGAGQVQAVGGVYAGGLQEFLAQGALEFGDVAVQCPAGVVDDPADQRVAVGVHAGGGHADHHVAGADALRTQQGLGLDHAGGGTGDVVLVFAQQARVLGGLAAHEGGAGDRAGGRDAAHDVRDALRDHLAAGDVVGHVERLGANHHDVVHHHAHQVEADSVVDVHGLGDGDLRADAVGGSGQQRPLVRQQPRDVVQAGEAADAADHRGVVGRLDGVLHELDGAVARFDVDPGGGVGDAGVLGGVHVSGRGGGSHTGSFLSASSLSAGTRSASVSSSSNSASGPGSQPVAPAFSAGSSSAGMAASDAALAAGRAAGRPPSCPTE